MANIYDYGDNVRCTGVFTTSAGVATDPTVVKFQYHAAGGAITTYTYLIDAQLVKQSTGTYYVDIDVSLPVTYYYRFYSTGTGQAAAETFFAVTPTQF